MCVLENLARIFLLGVGFPCCLELDCAGDVLVVFYFYLGVGNYLLCYVDP